MDAIRRVRNGESKAAVARSINVPESTLRGWCKNEDKIANQLQPRSSSSSPASFGSDRSERREIRAQPYNMSLKIRANRRDKSELEAAKTIADLGLSTDKRPLMPSQATPSTSNNYLLRWQLQQLMFGQEQLAAAAEQTPPRAHTQKVNPALAFNTPSSALAFAEATTPETWWYQFATLQAALASTATTTVEQPILFKRLTEDVENVQQQQQQQQPASKLQSKNRCVLDDLLSNSNNNNDKKVPLLASKEEAIYHGELFLQWMKNCDEKYVNNNITRSQLVQVRYLLDTLYESMNPPESEDTQNRKNKVKRK